MGGEVIFTPPLFFAWRIPLMQYTGPHENDDATAHG